MGKSTPSAPQAPDPTTTANAQTASNQQTALYNFGLNNPSVNTPLGSVNYSVSNTTPTYDYAAYQKALDAYNQGGGGGSSGFNPDGSYINGSLKVGPNGQFVPVSGGNGSAPTLSQFQTGAGGNPQSQENITLSPLEQQLFNQQGQQSLTLSNLATQLEGQVGNAVNTPTPTYADLQDASKKAQDAYYNSQMAYLQPQQATTQEQLNSQLANQGVMRGSDAYNTAEDANARQNTFANQQVMNNAILAGPQNAQALFGLASAAQAQPLNMLDALRSGSQVQMPNQTATTPSDAASTNIAEMYQNQYLGQQNAYNQQIASNNNTTNGLFGLAGNIGRGYAGSATGSAALSALFA